MINNKNVYNILYKEEKPNELIEKLEIEFPKKGRLGKNIREKKVFNLDETYSEMRKNLEDI